VKLLKEHAFHSVMIAGNEGVDNYRVRKCLGNAGTDAISARSALDTFPFQYCGGDPNIVSYTLVRTVVNSLGFLVTNPANYKSQDKQIPMPYFNKWG
jgi:hypothetical protein